MADRSPTEPAPIHSLGGAGAPPEMIADLRRMLELPEAARDALWTILGPNLSEPVPPDSETRLAAYCHRFELSADSVAQLLRACRVLLRQAHAHDTSASDFAADLVRLASDEAEADVLQQVLLPGLPLAMEQLQHEAISGAVADHGKLLVGVDWRLDSVLASGRGDGKSAYVGMLTLTYREGGRQERVTVQALPDTIAKLHHACEQMLARGGGDSSEEPG